MNAAIYSRVSKEFAKEYPDKVILKVTDYREKNIYVILAIPKDRLKDRNKWMDGAYSMDMKTYKIVGGFDFMKNDPDRFSSLPQSRIIYELRNRGKQNV